MFFIVKISFIEKKNIYMSIIGTVYLFFYEKYFTYIFYT